METEALLCIIPEALPCVIHKPKNKNGGGLETRLECPPIFIAPAKLLVALYSNLVLELHVGIVTK